MSDSLTIVIEVVLLIGASAICSGLNIAVMALDLKDIERKAKTGNKQAIKILPIRRRTHLTLAAILLTNVAAVSATSLVLEQKLAGLLAWILSTILIVVLGEIVPQAFFLKDPLKWTSRLANILKFMIIITYPLSRPLEKLLDRLLPNHKSALQTRGELGLLISEHIDDKSSELDDDEVEIMKGALSLSEKRVREITTSIQHTYWMTPETKLSDIKIDEIKMKGYSRIPILNDDLTDCYGLLLMKDLVDIDFDDNNYLVSDIALHPTKTVGSMTALDTMFRKFISAKAHLMPVERDDKIIGIVTIEDLIEEIIGHEIEDETDRHRKLIDIKNNIV
jgi:metal transporter CNNM